MTLSTIETLFSLLALAAAALALAAVAALVWKDSRFSQILRANSLPLMAAIATVATVGSLYFSEVENFRPCRYCWFQRVPMYSLAFILILAVVKKDHFIRPYARLLACVGAVISIVHYLTEWFPSLESKQCALDIPCAAVWYRSFGFVTLSFSALCGFVAILALSLLKPTSDLHNVEEEEV